MWLIATKELMKTKINTFKKMLFPRKVFGGLILHEKTYFNFFILHYKKYDQNFKINLSSIFYAINHWTLEKINV